MIGNIRRAARWKALLAFTAMLTAGLFLSEAMPAAADPAPATPTPRYFPSATPATQAGHGADVYYVHCMPCHGDRGQGLTDEFRTRVYPAEDADCWQSGCHGDRPYANGFEIPRTVPALIGPGALKRFDDAEALYAFISRSMPFHAPGTLTLEEYTQLTAFLLERNGRLAARAALAFSPPIGAVLAAPPDPGHIAGFLAGFLLLVALAQRRRRP